MSTSLPANTAFLCQKPRPSGQIFLSYRPSPANALTRLDFTPPLQTGVLLMASRQQTVIQTSSPQPLRPPPFLSVRTATVAFEDWSSLLPPEFIWPMQSGRLKTELGPAARPSGVPPENRSCDHLGLAACNHRAFCPASLPISCRLEAPAVRRSISPVSC